MTKEHTTGANNIKEVVYMFLNEAAKQERLPKTLFVQFDKCWRENNNR